MNYQSSSAKEERAKEGARAAPTAPPSDGATKHNTNALCDLASLTWRLFSRPKGPRRQRGREGEMRMGKGNGLSTRSRLRHSASLPRNGIHATLRHSPFTAAAMGWEGLLISRERRDRGKGPWRIRAKNYVQYSRD